jgi:hypothetical protein
MSGNKPLIQLQAKPFTKICLFFFLDKKEPKSQGHKEIFKRSNARSIKICKLARLRRAQTYKFWPFRFAKNGYKISLMPFYQDLLSFAAESKD